MLPSFILSRWVYKESKRFSNLGIETKPLIWAAGVFLPTAFFVFPLYLIKRNILWPEKIKEHK